MPTTAAEILDGHSSLCPLSNGPSFQCNDEKLAITSNPISTTTVPFLCRLAAIVSSSNDAIISKSLTGEIQTWNEAAERIYGYSANEVIGKSIAILNPEGERGSYFNILEEVRNGRAVSHVEAKRVKKNGDHITVDLTVSPIRNVTGAIIGASSVARDISDRKAAEELLLISEEQYRLLFKSNPVPMWVFDRNSLHFLAVNDASVRQYGYSESEFLAMTIRDIRPPEDIPNLLEHLNVRQSGLQEPGHWKHRRKDNTVIDVEVVAHDLAYQGHDGELVAAHDVTDRRRAQSLLQDSEAKYRVLFEESLDAYWLLSGEGYVDCNVAALRMFRLHKKTDFSHPADVSPPNQPDGTPSRIAADAKIAEALSQGSASFEWLHQRSNGENFPTEVRLSALQLGGRHLLMATVRDITERRRSEDALNFKSALLQAESETTIDGILAVDENDKIILANRQFGRHFEIPQELLDAKDDLAVRKLVTEQVQDPPAFLQRINYLYNHPKERSTDEIRLKTGKTFERYSAPLEGEDGRYRGRIWYFHDITERLAMEATVRDAEENYRTIFENAIIGIFRATPDGRPITVNRALAQIHGYDSTDELLAAVSNASAELFVNPDDMVTLVAGAAAGRTAQGAEVEVYTKTRARRWIRVNCQAVYGTDGKLKYVDGTTEDITDRKLAEERVETLAYYDPLTGLPNRSLLHDRLTQALARAQRTKTKVAALFIDLDRFKFINDSLGHTIGDLLLRKIADRLAKCVRKKDTVARIGGDEFVIVMGDVSATGDVEVVAARVLEELSSTFLIEEYSLHTSCSIGISLYPENGCDRETLIRYADQAMYAAKENGRSAYRFFSAELNDEIQRRTSVESDLRKALERNEFFLMYQPQMIIESGELAGFEVLLRWQHPEKGLVPPDQFIEIAENTGLILPIGEWVLRSACNQAKRWVDMGLLRVPVAVNISAVQFGQDSFCDQIARVLKDTGLPAELLELELTESLLLSNRDFMLSVLRQLRQMGIGLAIDDFGTGYSSLSYLRQFHVQKLKIDRSFIRELTIDADDAAITAAIIDMGKNLNLRVIAEGVEDTSQLEFLRDHRCDEIQGYLFSKPLVAGKIEEMLSNQKARSEPVGLVGLDLPQIHHLRARRPSLRRKGQ
ncbi:MAG TPA: EAL domain-containing protein [Terracidiphilus sp.]|nr:EAL domain-containing protein [Terracidiphilus sp.]